MMVRIDGSEYWIYDLRSLETKGTVTLWKKRRNHALRGEDRRILQRQELDGASVIERGTSRLTLREAERLLAELPEGARNKRSLSQGLYANSQLHYAITTYRFPIPASSPVVKIPESVETGSQNAEISPEVFQSPFTAWIPVRSRDLSGVPADQWPVLESEWERLGRQKMEALGAQIDRGNARVRDFLRDNVYLIFTLDAERFGVLSGGLPDASGLLDRLKGVVGRHSFLREEIPESGTVALSSLTDKARYLLRDPQAFNHAYQDWQRKAVVSAPVMMPRVEATILDAAFLSGLANPRETERFCKVKLASGDRLVLTYDRQKTSEERIVSALLSKFIRIMPFAYFYGRSGREISDRNLAKRIGPVSYVALFPVSATMNIKAAGNSTLVERSALADETFIKKVVESGVPLEHIFSIVQLGLLRGQLEDKGRVLKELTPQAFNQIIQFLNMLAESYKAEETLGHAA
jgi:hypothetical protein